MKQQKKNYNEMREYKGSVKLQKDLFSVQTRFSSMSGSWDIHTVFWYDNESQWRMRCENGKQKW